MMLVPVDYSAADKKIDRWVEAVVGETRIYSQVIRKRSRLFVFTVRKELLRAQQPTAVCL